MKKLALIVAGSLVLASCAGYSARQPVYHAASSARDDGYSEQRIDANRYRVQYRTESTDTALAQDWALRRAAELTLQNRYDWFQVIRRSRMYDDESFGRYDNYRWRDAYRDGPSDSRYNRGYPDYYDRDQYGDAVAVIEVIMGNAPPPRGSSIYNARQLLDYTRGRTNY